MTPTPSGTPTPELGVKSPMLLTYKYRIKDKRTRKALASYAVGVNQIWNWSNGYQRHIERMYAAGRPRQRRPSHYDLTGLTRGVTKDLGIHADTVGEICRHFAEARDRNGRSLNFRTSFGSGRSLGWVPFRRKTVRLAGNSISYLGKIFRLFGTKRRPLPTLIKVGSFVEDARGRWYLCVTAEADLKATGKGEVGIDLGLKTVATLSDGSSVPALQHYRRYERSLSVAQRAGNKARVKSIHAKIANARKDQIHKATTKIAKANAIIAIGNVAASKIARTRMAKSVLDASWYMFKTQLAYKASRHQAVFIEVDENNTSRSCSNCGAIRGPKGIAGLGIRAWECADCGVSHDRDVNAAKNILRLGQSALARADESARALS